MSIIAIRWAYSQPISNPVAKNVLVFLCTHDFPGNTSIFKISTICKATAYGERAIRMALNELHKNGYIAKQERFGESGQKLSNSYTILVPAEYVQKFTEDYDLLPTPRHDVPVPPAPDAGTPRHDVPDNKNNSFKNNIKKSFCANNAKNDHDNSRHEWADMKNEAAAITKNEEFKKAEMPESIRQLIKSVQGSG